MVEPAVLGAGTLLHRMPACLPSLRTNIHINAYQPMLATNPPPQVTRLVDETLEMTELTRLQHGIVGEGGGGAGLSVEQRKRLSIAVELVAAPAVMFLVRARAAGVAAEGCRDVPGGRGGLAEQRGCAQGPA